MRLKELLIRDLFSYHDAKVEFAPDRPISIFFGQNGSGKTSLRHIIEVLLTADVQDLDGTKIALERLRRTAADKGAVQGVFMRTGKEDLTVKRTVTGKGISTRVNGHENPGDISDHLGGALKPDLLFRALANVTGFFRLKSADQKDLLLSLIPQDVPADALKGLPAMDPAPKTLDDIELAYDKAFASRRLKKAELEKVPVPTNEVLNRYPVDIADIDARLTAITAEKDALLQQSGELISEARRLDQDIETFRGEVAEAEFELAAFAGAAECQANAERWDAEYTALDVKATAWSETNAKVVEESRRLQALAQARTKLEGVAGLCVIGGDVVCPMTPEAKQEAADVLQRRIDTTTETIRTLKEAMGAAPDIAGARKTLQEARQAVKDRAGWQEKLTKAQTRLENVTEKRGALSPAEVEGKLTTLRERIEKGKATREKAIGHNRESTTAKAAKAQREALTAEIADLEKLVAAFGPKGIRERLLVERIANMVGAVNTTLQNFGLALVFTDDPFEARINGMPAALMAESEQFRAGVALQVALANATGVRFVVVDGADVLDGPNRKALWSTLGLAVKDGLVDQAIVTATYTTAEPPRTFADGFAGYHISRTADGSTIYPLTA